MEQSKLSKPVLPPSSNTLAKNSGGKVYDIPGNRPDIPVSTNNSLQQVIPQAQNTNTQVTQNPNNMVQVPVQQNQLMQSPLMNRTAINNTPLLPPIQNQQSTPQLQQFQNVEQPNQFQNQSLPVQNTLAEAKSMNDSFVDDPNLAQQNFSDQNIINDQYLADPQQTYEEDPLINQDQVYVDPVVLQQRIQAQRRDYERQSNTARQINQFRSPKPLTNDSLKYLVGIAILSIIIYLIMRVL